MNMKHQQNKIYTIQIISAQFQKAIHHLQAKKELSCKITYWKNFPRPSSFDNDLNVFSNRLSTSL